MKMILDGSDYYLQNLNYEIEWLYHQLTNKLKSWVGHEDQPYTGFRGVKLEFSFEEHLLGLGNLGEAVC